MVRMEYLSPERLELVYKIPLAEVVIDFFDALKSRTKGYASLDYEAAGWERAELVKIDVLLNGVPVDAFSAIVHRSEAQDYGRKHDRAAAGADPPADVRRARSRRPSGAASSPARPSRPSARTCSPSATGVTSPASASCSRSRRKARSG